MGVVELIGPLALLMTRHLSLAALADVIPCHGTRFEVLKQLSGQYLDGPQLSRRAALLENRPRWWNRV